MSTRVPLSSAAQLTFAGLVAATLGVVVQIVSGVDFPTIPPVFFILGVPAVLVYFGRWRWAPVAAVLAGLFLTVGLFLSGESVRLFDVSQASGVGGSAGLWLQTVGVAVAAVAGTAATARNYRAGASSTADGRKTR